MSIREHGTRQGTLQPRNWAVMGGADHGGPGIAVGQGRYRGGVAGCDRDIICRVEHGMQRMSSVITSRCVDHHISVSTMHSPTTVSAGACLTPHVDQTK